jgi:hypothetical protein
MLNMSNESQPVDLSFYPELEEHPDCITIAELCELLLGLSGYLASMVCCW